MADTTLTGIFGAPIEALDSLVAASSTFQDWVGADDAAEAKAFIDILASGEEPDIFPSALIGGVSGLRLSFDADGGQRADVRAKGNLSVTFYDAYDRDKTRRENLTYFWEQCGQVIADMADTVAGGTSLLIDSIESDGIEVCEAGQIDLPYLSSLWRISI